MYTYTITSHKLYTNLHELSDIFTSESIDKLTRDLIVSKNHSDTRNIFVKVSIL